MPELGYCPRFHTAITADDPAGLCPSCPMQLALERTTESPDQSSGTESSTAGGPVADLAIPEIITANAISRLMASAQEAPPQAEIFGGYSFLRVSPGNELDSVTGLGCVRPSL